MKDILLGGELDLLIEGGDLVIDKSEEQEVQAILSLEQSNLKNSPLLGVGLSEFVNSESLNGLKARIRKQLKADNKEVSSINIRNGNLDVKLK